MGRSPYAEFRFACTLLRTNLQELQAVRSLDSHCSPSLWCFESQSGRGFGGQAYPAPAEALASLLAATAPSPARQPSMPAAPSTPRSATDADSAVSWGELDLALVGRLLARCAKVARGIDAHHHHQASVVAESDRSASEPASVAKRTACTARVVKWHMMRRVIVC